MILAKDQELMSAHNRIAQLESQNIGSNQGSQGDENAIKELKSQASQANEQYLKEKSNNKILMVSRRACSFGYS
jgi:acetyl-CoA carboxylase alpha subunit